MHARSACQAELGEQSLLNRTPRQEPLGGTKVVLWPKERTCLCNREPCEDEKRKCNGRHSHGSSVIPFGCLHSKAFFGLLPNTPFGFRASLSHGCDGHCISVSRPRRALCCRGKYVPWATRPPWCRQEAPVGGCD